MLATFCIGLIMNFTKPFMLKVTAKFVCVCRVQKLQQLPYRDVWEIQLWMV